MKLANFLKWFNLRKAKYGSNVIILIFSILGILVLINFFVYKNTKRWDLTEDKENTLSKQTVDLLSQLPSPVKGQAFFSQNMSYLVDQTVALLDKYKYSSRGKFDYRLIDPVKDPLSAQNAKITSDGSLVLTLGSAQQIITTITEQEITSAIIRLLNPEIRKIYFLTGHNEKDIKDSGDSGYTIVKQVLESKNYAVESLSLLAEKAIPDDAKVLVVVGCTQPIDPSEVKLIDEYLNKGGALVFLMEPLIFTQIDDGNEPLTQYILDNWGINLGNDVIVDLSSQQASYFAIGADYGDHPITKDIKNMFTIFPGARSVSLKSSIDTGVSQVVLIRTTQNAWAETDLEALKNNASVTLDEQKDMVGPVPIAIAAENFQTKARLVVIGDSDFAINRNFTEYGNGNLIINAIDWSAGEQQTINIVPRSTTQRVVLPPQKAAIRLIFFITVVFIPALALIFGVVAWIKRNQRG